MYIILNEIVKYYNGHNNISHNFLDPRNKCEDLKFGND